MTNNTEDSTPIEKAFWGPDDQHIEGINIHINVAHSNMGIVQTQRTVRTCNKYINIDMNEVRMSV